ncbi:hypothetical protein HGM15179_019027 [Zosterops borbonicus]|uniref:RING-type E3 ubiquitin transferase n=1 Tax=Zosterops borbonicus TaxID=364589 RepID=A0A8K1DB84_9PASS|nr:hypothetical protein HGM15179_019027 [Zosterops borbonicus]
MAALRQLESRCLPQGLPVAVAEPAASGSSAVSPRVRRNPSKAGEAVGVVGQVTHLDHEGKAVDVVCRDFSKAFDTVSHSTPLDKLAARGLDRSTLCWVRNWLDGQAQRVEVNGAAPAGGQSPVVSPRVVTQRTPQEEHAISQIFRPFDVAYPQGPDNSLSVPGLGQAPWDDETPGPSYSISEEVRATIATPLESSESSDEDSASGSRRTKLQTELQANADSNDSGSSSDNCVIVGYVG